MHTCRTNAEHVPSHPPPRFGRGAGGSLAHLSCIIVLHAHEFRQHTVLATAPDEQPSTVLDAVSTAMMCWEAVLMVRTAGTCVRRYRESWAHRSSSAPVTARITPLHDAAT
ncbi:hypothetical protein FB451DRAFT_1411293 [Mycena latifolia]|nr:hypothetical protein FB451DRAFT_1411293 [Mycena latifolia]